LDDKVDALPLPPGAETRSLSGEALFPPAVSLDERTKRKIALVEAREAARVAPENVQAVVQLSDALASLYRFRDAVAVLTEALEADGPKDPALFVARARHRLTLRRVSAAREDLERAAADGTHAGGIYLGMMQYCARETTLAAASLAALRGAGEVPWDVAFWGYLVDYRAAGAEVAHENVRKGPYEPRADPHARLVQLLDGGGASQAIEASLEEASLSDRAALGFGLAQYYEIKGDAPAAKRAYEAVTRTGRWEERGYIATELCAQGALALEK